MAAAERVAKEQIDQDNDFNQEVSDEGVPTPVRNKKKVAASRNAK